MATRTTRKNYWRWTPRTRRWTGACPVFPRRADGERAAAARREKRRLALERSTVDAPPARRKEPLRASAGGPGARGLAAADQTAGAGGLGCTASHASLRADDHHRETESAPSVVVAARARDAPATTTTDGASRDDESLKLHDHFEFRGRSLGKTPTSEAWLVRSKVSGARYCVKRVTEAFRSGAQRARCLHEVQAVTHLPFHENVVQYHRAWQEDRHFFAQMELCERGSFGACLDRLRTFSDEFSEFSDEFSENSENPPSSSQEESGSSETSQKVSQKVTRLVAERDVWRLARDVASGLAHCHAHGVLHLDVKPDNVFVSRDGAYKIGDFGVASGRGPGAGRAGRRSAARISETLNLHPAAPIWPGAEREFGERGPRKNVPTDRADVFSFGATLYEAACVRARARGVARGRADVVGRDGEWIFH